MDNSFDDKVNARGIIKMMDSQKIDKAVYLEHRFMNEEILCEYDNAMKAIAENLEGLDFLAEEEIQKSEKSSRKSKESSSKHSSSSRSSMSSKYSEKQSSRKSKESSKQTSKYNEQVTELNILSQNVLPSQFDALENDFLAGLESEPKVETEQIRHNDFDDERSTMMSQQINLNSQFEKGELIEDIEELIESLKNDGATEAEIPKYNKNASINELREVKCMLMRKWKRRYSRSIVEDLILMGVKAIENVFDGKTDILGFTPNLDGFGNSVMLSVKEHRQEISKVVERNCNKYGIGMWDKFTAKVITSAIKRSVMNKSKNNIENHSQHMRDIEALRK